MGKWAEPVRDDCGDTIFTDFSWNTYRELSMVRRLCLSLLYIIYKAICRPQLLKIHTALEIRDVTAICQAHFVNFFILSCVLA